MKRIIPILFVFLFLLSFGQDKTTITVLVPNSSDEVYIVGNQNSLGNWEVDKIKMIKVSNYERQVELDLSFPAEFKFTRGSWESEGVVADIDAHQNITLKDNNRSLVYRITHWSDNIVSESYSLNYKTERFYSKILDRKRRYKLFLPKNYSEDKKYPVFYITDAGWSNFEIALNYINLLASSDVIPEAILVGIVQESRGSELDVFWSADGIKFKNHLFKELVPHINEVYATSNFNAIIGHSDGAEYNHLLMLEKDNPFRGFINISTNLNNDVTKGISDFFRNYGDKNLYYFIAGGIYDSDDRLQAGKLIDSLFESNKNDHINFEHKVYKADHNNIVAKSMLDGISYIFKDYRNLETYNSFKGYSDNYLSDLKHTYGFEPNMNDNDIDYYFGKILDQKDIEAYEYLISFVADKNIFKSNTLDRANHYFYMEDYPKTIEFWEKTLENFKSIEPRVFYFNFTKAIDAYLYEQKPKEALVFLEKSKKRLPEYALGFNYFIAKTAIENDLKKSSYINALDYVEKNYKSNKFFSQEDLNVLKLKTKK